MTSLSSVGTKISMGLAEFAFCDREHSSVVQERHQLALAAMIFILR